MPKGIYIRTNECRKKLSDSKQGKHRSKETKRNISNTIKNLWVNEEYRFHMTKIHMGKKQSNETKNKHSECMKFQHRNGLRKEVYKNISKSLKNRTFEDLYGKDIANKIKNNISIRQTGRKLSNEQKLKQSNTLKEGIANGRIINAFSKGIKHTNTTGRIKSLIERKNISIGLKNSKKFKAIDNKNKLTKCGRKILSERMIGENNPAKRLEIREINSFKHKGKHHTEESILKIKKARAKQILPKKDTSIEVKIQNFLKQLNIEFFTHQYMHIEHGYQCDVFIPSMNLVIECDGNYWHSYPTGNDLDHIRTKELLEKGFKVLRLWGFEINEMSINEFKKLIK